MLTEGEAIIELERKGTVEFSMTYLVDKLSPRFTPSVDLAMLVLRVTEDFAHRFYVISFAFHGPYPRTSESEYCIERFVPRGAVAKVFLDDSLEHKLPRQVLPSPRGQPLIV